jgi:hypothetical protein
MACNLCGSVQQGKFSSEIDIHFPGLKHANKRPVVISPELVVCLNCGKAEFTIPKDELTLLAESQAPLGESLVAREPRAVYLSSSKCPTFHLCGFGTVGQ